MADNLTAPILFLVLAGGILPAIFWLWFWLREDKHPEPRGLILLSFLAGALTIILVLPAQRFINEIFYSTSFILLFCWAGIEEVAKLGATYFATLHRKALNEPVDYMIYLIATALGFAALENTLFMLKAIGNDGVHVSLITVSMRFMGAMLLHILASSTLGGIYALAYCKSRFSKIIHTIVGLIVATLIHALFNYQILITDNIFPVFAGLWLGVVILLLFFERVKNVVCVIPLKSLRK